MEFKFAINDVFKQPVVEINQSLVPPGFSGDRRALWDMVTKVTDVVNAMGEASATAQGLTKPITTAERIRNSEHKLYLLIDQNANNGKGAVTGMLKTGSKGLYVFDRDGHHYQVSPPCVLDFYIHESRQRTGLGKKLFEYMLEKEQIEPVKLAIDRPSDKFLGFLNKHYSLNSPVKQMNNYVVFDGFFPKPLEKSNNVESNKSFSGTPEKKNSANGLQAYNSPMGRYGAHRPPCSMGQIIHNQSSTINKRQEPAGVQSMPATNYQAFQNSSQPNQYVSQSVPNMQYGGQITNNQQYVPQGQQNLNEANMLIQNRMRMGSQQNISTQQQATNQFVSPVVNYANIPQHAVMGGDGYNQVQSYSNISQNPANISTNQTMPNVNTHNMPQMDTSDASRNLNTNQQAYQKSDGQTFNEPLQSHQNNDNSVNPSTPPNVYQHPSNIYQQHPNNVQMATSTPNMPYNMYSQPNNQMATSTNVYSNSQSTQQPVYSPQAIQSLPQATSYMQQPQISNNQYSQQGITQGAYSSQSQQQIQQPQASNNPRHHEAQTPAQNAYPNQQPSLMTSTPTQNTDSNQNQQPSHMTITPTQNTYSHQNQQPIPMTSTPSGSHLNQQPQGAFNQVQMDPQPIMNTNQYQPVQNQAPLQTMSQHQIPANYMGGNIPPQQTISQNQLQPNPSVPTMIPNQLPSQQMLNQNMPNIQKQMSGLLVDNQVLPNQMYQIRHPPLPLGHQSLMNLQGANQNAGQAQANMGLQNFNQNMQNQNFNQVGQSGDYAQQPPNLTQQNVNQSYSVPNVYGNYRNSPEYVNDAVQPEKSEDINKRNAKDVSEEGVLRYGYPIQMTKSQVFAQSNSIRQIAS
ncbi:hypothetical protein JTB14_037601 [Gonioctena quinquepunctata]|nr:hypothetical protein JTB14_037601 [Gonioctena quinquepunctata]